MDLLLSSEISPCKCVDVTVCDILGFSTGREDNGGESGGECV